MGGASNCWHRGCPKLGDSWRERNRLYSSATREEAGMVWEALAPLTLKRRLSRLRNPQTP